MKYIPLYQRFVTDEVRFTTQYSHLYLTRLTEMRPLILESCSKESDIVMDQIVDLKPLEKEKILIGTVIKKLHVKPSVIEEFACEFEGRVFIDEYDNFVSDRDTLFLEDETSRVELINLTPNIISQMITGQVIGVKGILKPTGEFSVTLPTSQTDPFFYPSPLSLLPQSPDNQMTGVGVSSSFNNSKIILISDIMIGAHDFYLTNIHLLLKTIKLITSTMNDMTFKMSRILICGVSVVSGDTLDLRYKFSQDKQKRISSNLHLFDEILSSILEIGLNVDLMPSMNEIDCLQTSTLPQQSISLTLFNLAKKYKNLRLVTQPYEFSISSDQGLSRRILATDSLIVKDIERYVKFEDINEENMFQKSLEVEIMKRQLFKWRHLAPNVPDSLTSYPIAQQDPFIVDAIPDIYLSSSTMKVDIKEEQESVLGSDAEDEEENVGDKKMMKIIEKESENQKESYIYHRDKETKAVYLNLPNFNKSMKFIVLDIQTLDIETFSIHS